MPSRAAEMVVRDASGDFDEPLVFSALDADVAGEIERAQAAAGRFVVSNARNHRMDPGVPLVVPEVNAEHLALLDAQDLGPGRIVTNPNCSTIGLVLALKPLADAFGVERAHVVTMQAISGAGLAGPTSFELFDNLIPFISGEEEKIESETQKILGDLNGDAIVPHAMRVSAQTTRVPVIDGHTETVSIGFEEIPSMDAVRGALAAFRGEPQRLELPTAPPAPIVCVDAPDRPQPRLDAERGRGMAITVGRIRRCAVLDLKLVALGHNTIRGAAGAAILNAELMVAGGIL